MWRGNNNSNHALTLKLEAYGDDSTVSDSTEDSNARSEGEDDSGSPVQSNNRKRKRSEEEKEEESDESENVESDTPEVVHQMEAEIERQLDTKAKKSNLTVANVKNIIKSVITNEHVLELVRHTMQQTESNFCINTVLSFTPKLTRSKTKELLNTFPSMAWSLPQSKTVSNSECKVLIEEELPEDSSDEEYRPDEDDQDDADNLKSESDVFNDCDDEEEEQDESEDADNFDDEAEEDAEEQDDHKNDRSEQNSDYDSTLEKGDKSKINHVKNCMSNGIGVEDDDDDDDEGRLVICDDYDIDDCRHEICDNLDSKDNGINSVSNFNTTAKESVSLNEKQIPKVLKECMEKKNLNFSPVIKSVSVNNLPILEENIYQRTRSKLCLSDTPLETIESAFMPPDITTDMYDSECDDENWKNFLKRFTEPLKQNLPDAPDDEDDEETDPEYNVMAEEEETEDKEELREDADVMVPHKEVHALMAELFEYSGMLFEDFDSKKKSNTRESSYTYLSKYNDDELNDLAEQIAGAMENHSEETEPDQCSLQPTHTEENAAPMPNPILNPLPISSSVECDEILSNTSCHLKKNYLNKTKNIVSNKAPVESTKMSHEQKLLFDQLLRKYVQLRTQHFLLSYLHPKFHVYAMDCKQYLMNLKLLSGNDNMSALCAANLDEALELVEKWEELHTPEAARKKYMNAIDNEIEHLSIMKKKKQTYNGEFPPGLYKIIANSSVFLYPSLLPTSPFRCEPYSTPNVFPSEDDLIALGLELFMNLAKENPKVWGNTTLYKVVPMIVEHFTPARKESTVYSHILECSNYTEDNPIKYYLENGRAPRTIHFVIPYTDLQPPCKMPLELLPAVWKTFIERNRNVNST